MSTAAPLTDVDLPAPAGDWIGHLPDGAVSIEYDGTHWKLRASQQLQARFEELLDRHNANALSEPEFQEYRAICDLDSLLSGFNRLARRMQQG